MARFLLIEKVSNFEHFWNLYYYVLRNFALVCFQVQRVYFTYTYNFCVLWNLYYVLRNFTLVCCKLQRVYFTYTYIIFVFFQRLLIQSVF